MSRFASKICLTGLLTIAVVLFACGEEQQQLECGEGTDLHDGQCVVSEHECDDEEVVTPQGECVDPAVFCDDEATVYDSGTGECRPDSDLITCGPGTVEQDGACVVEDPTECGEDTVLADGVCRLSEDVCGPGTELDESQCRVSEDACDGRAQFDVVTEQCVVLEEIECGEDTLESGDKCIPYATVADELAADADIDYGDGEPIVPSEDQSFIFTGTLDNNLEQTFELEGTEGQWLEIAVYQRGLPSPGFRLSDSFENWQRAALAGLSSVPTRTVAIPADDTFDLTVNTSLTDHDQAGSFGDESWQYVGTVDVVDAPEASQWDFESDDLMGDLTETAQNFVEIDVEEFNELFMNTGMLGEDVQGATVELWSDVDEFETRYDLSTGEQAEVDVDDFDELYLHFDAQQFSGTRTDFEVDARGAVSLPSGGLYYHEIDADAGETVIITHRSDQADPASVRVFRDGEYQTAFTQVLAENKSSYSTDETKRQYFYAAQDGTYLVEFQNTNDHELTSFISTSSIDDIPVFDVAAQGQSSFDEYLGGQDLYRGDWKIAFVDAKSPVNLEGTAIAGDYGLTPDVALYNSQGDMLDSEGSWGGEIDFEFMVPAAGMYYVAVQPASNWSTAGEIELAMDADAIEFLDAGQTSTRTFDVDAFDVLTGSIEYSDGPAPDVRLLNPNGQVVFEETGIDSMNLVEIFPGPGEFTLEVENTGSEQILGLAVDTSVSSTYDNLSVESGFSNTYSLDALDEGESDVLLFRPQTDFFVDFSTIFADDEEGIVRIWDVNNRELVLEQEGEQRVDVESEGITQGTYAIEFEALTDVDDYNASFSGTTITFVDSVRSYDPNLVIETSGGMESTALAVDGCDQISDISISMSMPSGSNIYMLIYLYAPGLDEPLVLLDGGSTSSSMLFPEENTPYESLDALIGTQGTGVWSLDIINDSSSITAELAEWGVHLSCDN